MQKNLLHPTYFPTIASFSLIIKEPCIMEVSDNYQKQTFRNRTYIYGANGKQLLTVPILHTGGETGRQLYKNVKIDNNVSWQKLHWKTLQTAYRTSPYFEFYEDAISPVFEKKINFLIDLNFYSIEAVLSCLNTDIQWDKTSKYEENYQDFNDFRFLANAKTEHNITQEEYYQIFSDKHGFIKNLSILDLLFHEGNHSENYLLNSIKM